MTDIRARIEARFESVARFIYRFRWITAAVMILVVAFPAGQLRFLRLDTSNEGFLHEKDPILIDYNRFRDQFGRDEFIILGIESDRVFSQEFLLKLKKMHREIEDNVPHLHEVTSLVNARNTRGEGDTLIVGDLLEDWPRSEADLAALKKLVLANPLYLNRLISADARVTTVAIQTNAFSGADEEKADFSAGFEEDKPGKTKNQTRIYLTDQENSEVVQAVEAIAAKYTGPGFKIYIAGSPVVTHFMKHTMMNDMAKFLRLVILTIAVCLFLLFRRLSGVLMPLFIVLLTLVCTVGFMAAFDRAIKPPTMILPSFLLAVCVGAAVHLLSMFYQALDRGLTREEALVEALGHSGLAIVMTSLTTAAGLASFAGSSVAPLADLGAFSSIGVMIGLVYVLVLLPALLAIFPIKARVKPAAENQTDRSFFDRFLQGVADLSVHRAKSVTAVGLVVVLIAAAGMFRLHFSHDILRWLPENLPARVGTEKLNNELRGTVTAEIILDTGKENGLYDPVVLKKLDKLAKELEAADWGPDIFVGKANSVADIIKEIHQALHGNNSEFYVVPDDPKLIPQELLLFENSGSDDLEDVIDSRFQLARFTAKLPFVDTYLLTPLLENLRTRFQAVFGESAKITVTGLAPLFGRTLFAAIHSAAKSYIIAGVVITLMMIFLIGNLRIGLIAMLPNLSPIIVTLGVIGWFDLPLDMFTMLIASIAIGLAVDDTVHFMHHFRRYYDQTGDVLTAVRETLHTAGRAMLVTSVVLSLGFFIFMFASMNNLFYFGLLTGITIIVALLADFFLAPALMALAYNGAKTANPEEGLK